MDNGPSVSLDNFKRTKSLGFTLINTLLEQLSVDYTFDNEFSFRLIFDLSSQVSRAHANLTNI